MKYLAGDVRSYRIASVNSKSFTLVCNTKNCNATVCASFDPAVIKIEDKKIAESNDNKILENPNSYK